MSYRVLILLATLLFCFSRPPISAKPLVFNSSYSPPYSTPEGDGILERILTEAFRRINEAVTFRRLPAERAVIDANLGVADGVVARVAGIEGIYPGLVMVPSPTIPRRDEGRRFVPRDRR